MLVKVFGSAVFGVDATTITVEVNIDKGIGYHLVGLPDSAIKESSYRIAAALKNNNYNLPGKKITINMAPADLRKEGSAYDLTLAIGIGIQNFPEGIAVSMPLRRMGMSRWKSFMYGQASAAVEPIAAVIGAVAVTFFTPILPYALAFAAGAMIFVVVEEVIPETQLDKNTDIATLGFIGGFIVMMILDVALG